jgi:hypothetical protein
MAVDVEQAGAVGGFVDQVVVPDLVVEGCGFGHGVSLRKTKRESQRTGRGAVRRAENSGRKRSRRQPAEEAPGQAAAVVEDDAHAADDHLAIWNHSTL